MSANLGILALLVVAGLSAFIWMYRRGKVAVFLDMARAELKKIKQIRESSEKIDAATQKKQERVAGGDPARQRDFWLRDD